MDYVVTGRNALDEEYSFYIDKESVDCISTPLLHRWNYIITLSGYTDYIFIESISKSDEIDNFIEKIIFISQRKDIGPSYIDIERIEEMNCKDFHIFLERILELSNSSLTNSRKVTFIQYLIEDRIHLNKAANY